jgi:hypothetical protein
MSNKETAVQEAIDLIKQDYEANGRLRLAFVLQTLNKAEELESQKQQKYDEMVAMLEGIIAAKDFGLLHQADFTLIEQLIKEAKEL